MSKKYKFLTIFILFIIIGIIVKLFFPNLWEWFGVLDTASAVALSILAGLGYLEYARSEDSIKIIFEIEGKRYDTGLSLLRKNFTRGELMGILGMIQKKQKEKFSLKFFQDKSVLKKLQNIQIGKEKEFIINMTQDESKQFIL